MFRDGGLPTKVWITTQPSDAWTAKIAFNLPRKARLDQSRTCCWEALAWYRGWYRQGGRDDDERRGETTIKISFSPGLHSPRDGAWRSWRPLARKRPSLRALAINVLHMPPMQAHWARLHLSAVERVRDSNGNDVSPLPPSCHHSWLSPARRRLQAL